MLSARRIGSSVLNTSRALFFGTTRTDGANEGALARVCCYAGRMCLPCVATVGALYACVEDAAALLSPRCQRYTQTALLSLPSSFLDSNQPLRSGLPSLTLHRRPSRRLEAVLLRLEGDKSKGGATAGWSRRSEKTQQSYSFQLLDMLCARVSHS